MKEGLNHPPGYAGLMEMMAEAMAIDLDRHVAAGTLAESTIDRMKLRCALCTQPRACQRLLSGAGASLPPDFCVNRQILEALRTQVVAKSLDGLARLLRISAANIGPNRFHQYRTVSWLSSIPRSWSRSSTFRSDSGNRTYIITAGRMSLVTF